MELDWQNGRTKIKERGLYLLQTEKWADCHFLVGTHPNQQLIAGHKLFLAMSSAVFERMFFGNLADKTDPIVIPDVQPDAFKAMLLYIYSDTINITSFDKACELCYVAKKYMLPHVVESCTHFLWSDLSPKNACRAYEFARLFDEPRLMKSSMEIIAANTREVIADPSFVDIEISTLMAILDRDQLNIDSELDLFNGLVKYATERGLFGCADRDNEQPCTSAAAAAAAAAEPHIEVVEMQAAASVDNIVEEIKMEPDVAAMLEDHDDEQLNPLDDVVVVDSDASVHDQDEHAETASNISVDLHQQTLDESLLRQAVKKIRFLTLTPQQFAEGPARSKLLQQHEALAILIKISSPNAECQMPEGFCSSRSRRNYYETTRTQFERSSYRLSTQPAGQLLDNSAAAAAVAAEFIVGPDAVTDLSAAPLSFDANMPTNDTRRSYCVRTVSQYFDYRNCSVTDCGVTFQVDTNIWITGVQVPTQVLCGELMNSAGFSDRYTEILYAHIQDMQGSRLSYTHCTSRVRYDSLLEISFDRPVYIYRNQIYKIFVVFNKVGWYPMYTCIPDVICNRVKFMFNVGDASESTRDGLIRAIVFSTPQQHSRSIDC